VKARAKLNREIGTAASGAGGATFITIHTNVNFMALKAASVRAAKVPPAIAERSE
jgi:hypothetical protein